MKGIAVFRWLRVFSTYFSLALFVSSIALVLLIRYQKQHIPEQSILHITLDGSLEEQPGIAWQKVLMGQSGTNIRTLTRAIRTAAQDPRIAGVVFDIRHPTLGLAQVQEVASAMQELRKSGTWNVAYLDTVGEGLPANGAFALATQASEVLLAPCGDVLLSGLKAEVPFFAEMLRRLKIQVHVEKRAEYKNYANTYTETGFTAPHKEALAHVITDLQQSLLQLISQGRDKPEATVLQWLTQGIFTGEKALAEGLIDRLQYWDEVITLAESKAGREEPLISLERYLPAIHLPEDKVEVAYLVGDGAISRSGGSDAPISGEDGINAYAMREALAQAFQDKVKAVLLRINSPGGSYVASDIIRRELQRLRAADIPVVVSMGDVAASGGYLIAQEAEHIVAQPGTITGSIGVVSLAMAFRQPLQHWFGITWDSYQTLPDGYNISFLDAPTASQKLTMSQHVDTIYATFLQHVAKGRQLPLDKVEAVAKGRIWSGRQALAHGLVDSLGGIDTAIAYLHKRLALAPEQTIILKSYHSEPNPFEMFKRFLKNQVGMQAMWHRITTWLPAQPAIKPSMGWMQSPHLSPSLD